MITLDMAAWRLPLQLRTFVTVSAPVLSLLVGSAAAEPRFIPVPFASGEPFTSVALGPDWKLYAGTLEGKILRFGLLSDGSRGSTQTITTVQTANGGNRALLGLAFDPAATADSLILWVTHSSASLTSSPACRSWTRSRTRIARLISW